jgi:two-component system phosphate regulon response regulator PhoB
MRSSVLVVDDDPDIAGIIAYHLEKDGLHVHKAGDGRVALEEARRHPPDLIVLDLMLPGLSGLEVLKLLRGARSTSHVPVILLTAKTAETDRVVGFELGADDYVTKPFSPRELLLRVRAILRRRNGEGEPPEEPQTVGPIEVDLANHTVCVDGRSVSLTLTEFRLLSDLVRAAGRVRTREALLNHVWGYDAEVMSRTIDTHVRRLRSKLGTAAAWVATVRGVGYRIQDPAER